MIGDSFMAIPPSHKLQIRVMIGTKQKNGQKTNGQELLKRYCFI